MSKSVSHRLNEEEWSFFCCFLQWGDNVWIFCAYKCFIALYWLGWIIVALVLTNNPSYMFFLTNWGVWTILLYFLVSSGVCIYSISTRNSWARNRRNTTSVNTISVQTSRSPPSGILCHLLFTWKILLELFDTFQVCTFHDGCKRGIDQQIFNRKSISRKITHPQSWKLQAKLTGEKLKGWSNSREKTNSRLGYN